jgi:hypothetical protein
MEEYKPPGYPVHIMTGLAREMEKHGGEKAYLYDAVVCFHWTEEDFREVFTYRGMSYDELNAEYVAQRDTLIAQLRAQYPKKSLTHAQERDLETVTSRALSEQYLQSFLPVFKAKYREENASRKASALGAFKASRAVQTVELYRDEYYSKFTKVELFGLAAQGFDCSLVGKRECARPDQCPLNINEEPALVMGCGPEGAVYEVKCGYMYFDGVLPNAKYPGATQFIVGLLNRAGIEQILGTTVLVENIGDTGKKTYVHATFPATAETILSLARQNPKLKITRCMHAEAYPNYHFDRFGDGYAVLPAQEVND